MRWLLDWSGRETLFRNLHLGGFGRERLQGSVEGSRVLRRLEVPRPVHQVEPPHPLTGGGGHVDTVLAVAGPPLGLQLGHAVQHPHEEPSAQPFAASPGRPRRAQKRSEGRRARWCKCVDG